MSGQYIGISASATAGVFYKKNAYAIFMSVNNTDLTKKRIGLIWGGGEDRLNLFGDSIEEFDYYGFSYDVSEGLYKNSYFQVNLANYDYHYNYSDESYLIPGIKLGVRY